MLAVFAVAEASAHIRLPAVNCGFMETNVRYPSWAKERFREDFVPRWAKVLDTPVAIW